MGVKIYTYHKCGTCRKATKWLDAKHVHYREFPIRETPPSRTELKVMLEARGGDVKKLFNTSGMDYRKLGLKEILADMPEDDAIELLSTNGNLVKRPFVLGDGIATVGFNEDHWEELFKEAR